MTCLSAPDECIEDADLLEKYTMSNGKQLTHISKDIFQLLYPEAEGIMIILKNIYHSTSSENLCLSCHHFHKEKLLWPRFEYSPNKLSFFVLYSLLSLILMDFR